MGPRFTPAVLCLLTCLGCDRGEDGAPVAGEAVTLRQLADDDPPAPEPGAAEFPSELHRDTFATTEPSPLPACDRIWSADLVGDGADEIVCTRANELWVFGPDGEAFRQRLSLTGSGLPNAAWHGDRDRDGKEEFVIAFGMGRGFATAPVRVLEIDRAADDGGWTVRQLFEYTGSRPQVSSLWGPDLYLSHFVSKYEVTGGYVRPGNALEGARVVHMGMTRLLADLDGDGVQELAIGRIYGDEPRSDGDLTVHDGDQAEIVPTFRGVKSMAVADLDGDGVPQLVFGDGWHYKYRDEGKGRLNVAHRGADGYGSELLVELPGQFAVMKIEVLERDQGPAEILAGGNDLLFQVHREDETWEAVELGACPMGEFAVARRSSGALQVAVAGSPVQWIDLRRPRVD